MKLFLTALMLVSTPTWLARAQNVSSAVKTVESKQPFLFIGKATPFLRPTLIQIFSSYDFTAQCK